VCFRLSRSKLRQIAETMGKGRNDEGDVKLHMKAYTDINIRPWWIWRIIFVLVTQTKEFSTYLPHFPLYSRRRGHTGKIHSVLKEVAARFPETLVFMCLSKRTVMCWLSGYGRNLKDAAQRRDQILQRMAMELPAGRWENFFKNSICISKRILQTVSCELQYKQQ
jgi:hypothetical protein